MSAPASVAKHPIHPMLVVFPLGLWVFSFVSDIVWLLGGSDAWNTVAFYTIAGGVIGALGAAVPGVLDMFSIADRRVRKIAWNHMILNLVAVAMFALNWYLRAGSASGEPWAILLSAAGIITVAVSGWLGGEMVYVHGVGVEQQQATSGPAEKRQRGRVGLRRLG